MKNTYVHKKIVPTMVVFLSVILTLSLLLAQMPTVNAQDGAASLTGKIYDAYIDANNDRIYDSLVVRVEVNVTTAGTFTVDVSGLSDASSNTITVSNQNSTSLDEGIQTVYVTLDGPTIYESENNPVTVSSITLYDESDNLLDSLADISLPGEYSYADFGIPPARFTGTVIDEGIDSDEDGAYDSLLIGLEVNVTEAGTFTAKVLGLYDSSYQYIEVTNQNSTYLDTGVQFVYVSLPSTAIYASAINPETVAIINLSDDSGTSIDAMYDVSLSETYVYTSFQHVAAEISFNDVQSEVVLSQSGSIYVTNIYSITNIGFWTNTIDINLPENAYDFEVRDAMGTLETTTDNSTVIITLRNGIDVNETETIYTIYYIQWEKHVTQQNGVDYTLSVKPYEQFNTTIKTLTVSITLPKGAEFKSSNTLDPNTITKNNIQETIEFSFSDVTPSDNLDFEINYKYDVFWASFYPTMWIGILAVIISAAVFFWGKPTTISAPTIQVPLKDLKSFVDTYEEKTTIQSELKSLEERLQKGKIPRRRYKVRKKMLDGRLSTVSRTIFSLRETIRASGSKYARMMSQLEVAEAKLEGAERDMQRVKSRYNHGEISKGAYGKLLEEYQNRIEDAAVTIDGVLLRLRD
ncbi:MAG: hypothetical protein CW691_09065 [Candidatus Bathyarchaeum sp.]|nr:MAG: hypothetical protein CW691_09065 [Candidatus Bathyarchaeum sp.]